MKQHKFILRVFIFSFGLLIMAFGVAFSVKADLGVSPVSCVPYIFSLHFDLTLGELTVLFNILLIVLQVAFLGRKYRISQLIQLPVIFGFGFFIDFAVFAVSGLTVIGYFPRLMVCLLSCAVIGLGVFFEVKAGITYLPGEGLALAVSSALGAEFGKAKMAVDSSMVLVGVICSFFLSGTLQGIREGTVIAAVTVGILAKFYIKKIRFLDTFLAEPDPVQ